MKKEYEAPKAEKMEFDYAEAVIASGTHCNYFVTETEVLTGCKDREVEDWSESV